MNKKGFTFIEILIGLSISAAIFIIATSLVVNIFSSTTKSKQMQVLEQAKNDLQAEFGNSVRWADSISYIGNTLQIDTTTYTLQDGVVMRNGSPITPSEVEVTDFDVVRHETAASGSSLPSSGTGLTSQYFNNADLTMLAFTQTDFSIDFNWGNESPDPLIDEDTFSIRFSGEIEAPTSSEYTFTVASDDGARLWINNSLIIDDWGIPGFSERTGRVNLIAGQKYPIRLEYYDSFGQAQVSLYWTYFGVPRQIVPTSRLYPNTRHSSIEIVVDMKNRNSASVVDTMRLVLSPRSGNVGVVE